MKILISGISGFVGQNLVEFFKKDSGIEFLGVDIIQPQIPGVSRIYSWDELNLIPEVDAIIHLAGKAHDVENKTQEDEYFAVNYGLTKVLYDYFLTSSTKKFFFISSVKAVADTVNHTLTEDFEPNPKTPYGKSKLKAEEYILAILPENKKVYIFRPCMIYGKNNKGNLNLLYKMVSKGIPWPLGSFKNKRSLLSIINFSFIIGNFVVNNYASGIYNLSDSETISTNELVNIISKASNRKVRILRVPMGIIRVLAVAGTFFHLGFNKEQLKKLTENYLVSNKKLIDTINKSLPVKTSEGLLETFKYFKGH